MGEEMNAFECFALLPVVKILECLFVLSVFELRTVQHCFCKVADWLTKRCIAAVAEDLVVIIVSNFQLWSSVHLTSG